MSCQKKATGKFIKVVCIHTAINWDPAFLNNIVAIKLIIGHIMQIIITEIAIVITIGLSFGANSGSSERGFRYKLNIDSGSI